MNRADALLDLIALPGQGDKQIGDGATICNNLATDFASYFISKNNEFHSLVMKADETHAVIDTVFGPLRRTGRWRCQRAN